jgi:flagellar assembly factor FliW
LPVGERNLRQPYLNWAKSLWHNLCFVISPDDYNRMNTLEVMPAERPATNGDSHNTIQLPYGLLGFERVKNYRLLTRPEEQPFMWFQMIGELKKAFLVVPPHFVVSDYAPDLGDLDVAFLELNDPSDAFVLNIVTMRAPGEATVNLKGPIVINRRTLIGKQVIPVNAAEYAIRHPLPSA